MGKKLFLLDGMALVYRAHFALVARPIFTSKGVNTSALYGFTQTLLEIIKNQQPTHFAVAFDTAAPTARHVEFPEYKAQREEMPEDLSKALPHVRRMVEAFNIPLIICDGYEADDLIGTLVRKAEKEGFVSYMVTPDKDFGQLVDQNTFLYKPSRMGEGIEILGLPEILQKWGVQRPEQVIDVLGLWGDVSDNIPGVPGIGEKTAAKLIAQYGSVENLLAHTAELKGKLKENLEAHREQALLSKRLATINCEAPCSVTLEGLEVKKCNEEALKNLFVEFEFNSIGRRLFGDDYKAGRGFDETTAQPQSAKKASAARDNQVTEEFALFSETEEPNQAEEAPIASNLKTINDVAHDYRLITDGEGRSKLIKQLAGLKTFCFDTETTSLDTKEARLIGLAFAFEKQKGFYVAVPADPEEAREILQEFRAVFENEQIQKVGHNLKYDLAVLKWHGVGVHGKLFDTMLAHSLIEPEMRHGMDYMSEVYLGYSPISITKLIGDEKSKQLNMADVPVAKVAEYAAEDADVTWQLWEKLEPLLKEKGQERVFYEVEAPLIPVLTAMEYEGIKVDASALAEFSTQLSKEMANHEQTIYRLAGQEFNLNSPRQLGEILFDKLKISENAKKTKTGQYATNEQTLMDLAADHEIVQRLLDYRGATKLKSTYADALPGTIWKPTGRVHTTFNQAVTTTGRLNSQNPNLQNIPIRTEQGKEIRKAFVPRNEDYVLLSADYSQIELRIIAALSHEQGMLEDFGRKLDIHTATAARVYGVPLDQVTPEMRRKAKMVNYGIAYGISAFGLAQRLRIPRKEAATIIEQYFAQYPGIAKYMRDTIDFAKQHGYVETVTGRRRYMRDIRSANAAVRGGAERNAINAPIQGTAADMIKIAMINIHGELTKRKLKSRMLLQVHDELVFDVHQTEENEVRQIVEEKMRTAIQLEVPIEVEIGSGKTWLEAH
ncbi:DNA polymerase I [Pedosphaera parvula]|uniref:DNA polymerase I n=1 Tax=Pedosphaera parvula (strain Ellin514) TaxID=320771 RepID=B9XB89_PEDPL|nr:DNA polymerase I [Pedosphaera parvula]EEF62774.1 DNA polymerase I [Pedosphaera parvula Ellin514]